MGTQPFEVTVRDRTVRVRGDVDLIVTERLRQSIQRAARDVTGHTVTVDLERTTFMDSAGISALIACHKQLEAAGQELLLENVPSTIQLMFSMVGVVDFLNVRSTLA